ncbi:hypothetical protein BDF14DRAFT_1938293 [Spinellus fusiger]|nr:hypothetical protein BDF14DRAFT_1938293 [Spinellus fusiger]
MHCQLTFFCQDISSFPLPLSWKPGSDLMSKLLFNDPIIVNLVVKSLLGTDVPEDIYTVALDEWADDFNSTFIVYISQNESSSRFTPIIINIREVVDSDSMSDTILFSTLVYEKYNISPIVLIIPSSSINREELGISEDTFLIPFKSTF